MLAIDWSHTKGLTIYDGKKCKVETRKSLLKRLKADGVGEESKSIVQSRFLLNSPTHPIILEQECPLSLIYDILRTGHQLFLINNMRVKGYRESQGWEKTDENDAKAIYELAESKPNILVEQSLDEDRLKLLGLYRHYIKYQKARVALQNMKSSHLRAFGDGEESIKHTPSTDGFNPPPPNEGEDEESKESIQSTNSSHSSSPFITLDPVTKTFHQNQPDSISPYDVGIKALLLTEKSLLKQIVKLTPPIPETLSVKGLGPRLWAGIYVTANPTNFPKLSGYLRYCGLVNLKQLDHKYNRHARVLYRMLAVSVLKLGGKAEEESSCSILSIFEFNSSISHRAIYDKCKADITEKHADYTKLHIHNAALNRMATFLAKEIWQRGRESKRNFLIFRVTQPTPLPPKNSCQEV